MFTSSRACSRVLTTALTLAQPHGPPGLIPSSKRFGDVTKPGIPASEASAGELAQLSGVGLVELSGRRRSKLQGVRQNSSPSCIGEQSDTEGN